MVERMLYDLVLGILSLLFRISSVLPPTASPLPPEHNSVALSSQASLPDGLTAEAVPEGGHQPEGEALTGITAREATMLLQDMVPHPGALALHFAGVAA